MDAIPTPTNWPQTIAYIAVAIVGLLMAWLTAWTKSGFGQLRQKLQNCEDNHKAEKERNDLCERNREIDRREARMTNEDLQRKIDRLHAKLEKRTGGKDLDE